MAKVAPDATIDGMHAVIASADEMYVCSGVPTNYADIVNVDLVGPIALTPGDGGGDFVIADGDTSGRKITVGAQTGASVTTSGTAINVVLATGGATDLIRYVTECTSQALTSGNTANVGAWSVEVLDPT